jgi:hypothetical protein
MRGKLIILLTIPISTFAFLPSGHLSFRSSNAQNLNAKKANKRKSNGGQAFGGFASKQNNSNSKNTGKTRVVSGYTGSGTKPLRIAANTFDSIRKKYEKECLTDLYLRSPLNDKQLCWFVGKTARKLNLDDCEGSSKPTELEAVISQKRLIIEYAKNQLRPQNFGGPYSKDLELWMAPGDTEMDVVQNKISLKKVVASTKELSEGFSVNDVGFNPEIYVGDEMNEGGLRVSRDEEGHPIKPTFEINA